MDPQIWLWLALIAGVAALGLAAYFGRQVTAASPGNELMRQLMADIREGAMAFIKREYTAVAAFVVVLAVLILVFLDWGWPWGALAYVFGAVLSALAGYIGMRTATAANARTAEAARVGGITKALPLAFRGGAVMGFTVAGLGLLGLSLGYWFFEVILEDANSFEIINGDWPRSIVDRAVLSRWRRDLHQGRRYRCRSRWKGRSRHSGGRSSQPRRDRRQRR